MKKTKIIIPALAVLLLSTAASVSGTVAWFSMNTAIKVDGMKVKTKVGSNLQIAVTNSETEYTNADLTQDRSGMLEPASTVDGDAFFWTTNADFKGDAKAEEYNAYSESTALANSYAGKANYDAAFNSAYGYKTPAVRANADEDDDVSYAYIDYSFYLKTYFSASGEKISLSKCNMLYNNGVINSGFAWRVGVFSHAVAAETAEADSTTVSTSGALVSILDFEHSKNQNEVSAVQPEADTVVTGGTYFLDPQLTTTPSTETNPATSPADGKRYYYQQSGEHGSPKAIAAASGNSTMGAVSQANTAAVVATSTAAGNARYKIVVRLWLEGEDVSCTTETFANLTAAWTLDLEFSLDDGTHAVTNIGSVAA